MLRLPLVQTRYKRIKKAYKKRDICVLDVGSGNNSPSKFRKSFPGSIYHGIDLDDSYNYSKEDLENMDRFFKMDLTKLNFDEIPNNFYDAILFVQIIEHLQNGDKVIEALTEKLKQNAFIYIEYPSKKSTKFPSKKGTLNFYDDPTHVRLYDISELECLLKNNGFQVVQSGIRRDFFNILIMPLKIAHNLIKYGYVMGSVYWDWYGFAEFVWAQKKK